MRFGGCPYRDATVTDGRARIRGRRLAQARQAAGLTQAQLADLASVTYQEISHDEAGRRQRPIDRAIQIAEILGWDVQELWGISDREEK
ncbi:transcriptional regulator, XRE family [Acidothermus cellulolyticus 11B]|uniref:Transcriptional regulator, XRE family n=1 Tax=Acidothermus cellulolyticus (strain ATCC 43068 / DSM 8971 / 11B) TaxID=351607 RepID=A0LVD5_ACIC1|nr:transcriptional regulator, XRE family [Acidothermus cellulolyticus 11B]MCL6549400.1 helix-turn-helix domain-containing protein [Acidothermus cellulolyticus]